MYGDRIRSNHFVFIGYAVTQKDYKVLDYATNQLFISTEIIFNDFHFPLHVHTQLTIFPTAIYLNSVITPTSSNHDEFIESFHSPDHSSTSDSSQETSSSDTPSNSHDTDIDSSVLRDLSLEVPQLRKSIKTQKTPSYLSSYQCHNVCPPIVNWCILLQSLNVSLLSLLLKQKQQKIHDGLKLWSVNFKLFPIITHGTWYPCHLVKNQ